MSPWLGRHGVMKRNTWSLLQYKRLYEGLNLVNNPKSYIGTCSIKFEMPQKQKTIDRFMWFYNGWVYNIANNVFFFSMCQQFCMILALINIFQTLNKKLMHLVFLHFMTRLHYQLLIDKKFLWLGTINFINISDMK